MFRVISLCLLCLFSACDFSEPEPAIDPYDCARLAEEQNRAGDGRVDVSPLDPVCMVRDAA